MRLNLLIILLSFASLGSADINETRCESTSLSGDSSDIPDNDSNVYVMCSGNFTDMKKLKESLENIKYTITAFELQNALLDALPPDVFHYVRKPSIQKITFRNVKMGLLGIPDLGSPPFKTVKDTVESLEIHNCSSVFAWNLKSLDLEHLKTFIVEDSDVTAITHTLIMWPNLRFIQLVHTGIYWIHNEAFQHNKKLTICSLAYNKIKLISRNLFPKPASFLYSIDFSFNKLLWLPEDVFSDMNVLQELKLDNNNLIHVSFKLLSPTWSNLTQLWLHELQHMANKKRGRRAREQIREKLMCSFKVLDVFYSPDEDNTILNNSQNKGNPVDCGSLCWMSETIDKPLFLESSSCNTWNHNVISIESYLQSCKRRENFDNITKNDE